jgi:D-alanine-D-alanine ligase
MASAIAMNKVMTKRVIESAGVPTPPFLVLTKNNLSIENEIRNVADKIGYPVVVKPACEGSTIGISIVKNNSEIAAAIELAFSYDKEVVVEKFIEGTEITVGILGNDPIALPTLEIVTETDFYDYETKYTAGLSKHIIPARMPEEYREKAQKAAIAAHKALNCRGYSRVDVIVDNEGTPHVLEINTLPGMTKLSLYPDSAKSAGYEFPELISKIVELALE